MIDLPSLLAACSSTSLIPPNQWPLLRILPSTQDLVAPLRTIRLDYNGWTASFHAAPSLSSRFQHIPVEIQFFRYPGCPLRTIRLDYNGWTASFDATPSSPDCIAGFVSGRPSASMTMLPCFSTVGSFSSSFVVSFSFLPRVRFLRGPQKPNRL
jgi:hypothetical protein